MALTESTEDKVANLLLKLLSAGEVEKIAMTKRQHEIMESLVIVYMLVASTGGDLNSIATLDGIWDSTINIT